MNLASDGSIPAANTDPNLIDPWGIAASPTGYLWAGDNGTNVATLYDGSGTPQSLVVSIPGGSPTGVAFNPYATTSPNEFVISSGTSSGPATFLFASLSGEITGWNANVPPPTPSTSAQAAATVAAEFTGLAMATSAGSDFLYAADFHDDDVDVFDSNFNPVGSFTDATLPAGYPPYNIANIGGDLYVTFALQDTAKQNPVPGLGNGYVDVFSPAGVLLDQLIANGLLDEPWGIAPAPSDFGQFSGDLLVANHGNGQIEAFDPTTGALVGPFLDGSGVPVSIDGLRGLSFGNGGSACATNTLYFTAGPVGGAHGLLGSLAPQVLQTGPTSVVSTATIMEAALKASVVNVSAVEGNPFIGVVANFTDDNVFSQPGDYTATIDWGDGSPTTTGTVLAGNTLGSYIVEVGLLPTDSNAKVYTEETGGADHPQPFNITVTIAENDGDTSVTADGFANVADAPLLPGVGIPVTGTIDAGYAIAANPFTVATFVDTNADATPSDFVTDGQSGVALVDWGDGSTSLGKVVDNGPVSGGESFAVQDDHTYLKGGTFEIKISITDIGGKTTSATSNVVVNALHATVVNVSAVEGNTFTGVVANFTDDNTTATASDFTAAINWGGAGTGSSLSILPGNGVGAFIVLGTFTYANETGSALQPQPDNISVTITDGGVGGQSAVTADGFANVADAALVPAGPINLGSVLEGTTPAGVAVASFSDADMFASATDFLATIDWGDGTAGGCRDGGGGTFIVTGTKPSPYLKIGPAEIKVSVLDIGGKSASMVADLSVVNAPLVAGPSVTLTGTEGQPLLAPPNASPLVATLPAGVTSTDLVTVATFTDSNPYAPATDATASIDWGDGSTGAGTIVPDGLCLRGQRNLRRAGPTNIPRWEPTTSS